MTGSGLVEIEPFGWKVLRKHRPGVSLIADVKEVREMRSVQLALFAEGGR